MHYNSDFGPVNEGFAFLVVMQMTKVKNMSVNKRKL